MMAATSLPNYLAGNGDLGSWEPTQIFAGEADIVTEGSVAGADIAIYQVIAKNAAGAMVPYDPTATADASPEATPAPQSVAIGIAAQPAKSGQNVPYYIGGVFNHAALGWPATVDTLVKRQAVFDRTNIHIGNLY
ncbi:head decoration protein D [Salmonella phage vB_SentM_sal2]|nr:head decoration protein D [Salmonella phage vB_SentM_sal2]